jgi:hypothetical protein
VRLSGVNDGPAHCRHQHGISVALGKALHHGKLDGVGGHAVTARNSASSAKMAATPMASAIKSALRIFALLNLGFQVVDRFVWRAAVTNRVKRGVEADLHGEPVALAAAGRVEPHDDAPRHSAALR